MQSLHMYDGTYNSAVMQSISLQCMASYTVLCTRLGQMVRLHSTVQPDNYYKWSLMY